MRQRPQARMQLLRLRQPHRRRIAAAIVNIDDLELPPALKRGVDLREQRQDVLRFVADGDDYGKLHMSSRKSAIKHALLRA